MFGFGKTKTTGESEQSAEQATAGEEGKRGLFKRLKSRLARTRGWSARARSSLAVR